MMTVEVARKILGDEYKDMPDEEIERLVIDLTFIARGTIKDLANKKSLATDETQMLELEHE